jgi:large subunit ribosomal protein L9
VDVILLEDVDKLGLRGEVVSVARGYARNYLLPRRLAEEASAGRVGELRKREERLARQQAESFEQAQQIAERLAGAELRFDVKAGPTGSLFGSVTATDVADALWNTHKVRVDRRNVDLHEPIKRIGRFTVPVELFTDVTVELRTLVVPEGGELPPEEELQAMEAAEQAVEQAEAEAAEAAHAEAEAAVAAELEEPEPEETEEAEEAPAEASGEGPAAEG